MPGGRDVSRRSKLYYIILILKLSSSYFTDALGGDVPWVELSFCFSKILARTTFVLVSLLEGENPGRDAILGHFVFGSSELMIIQSNYL